MSTLPETRFARNGDVHIAYQTGGSGPLDLLLCDTWVHHVEAVWDFPDFARFLRRLSSFGRLIHFDRRGTGLSDPVPLDELPDQATQVEDAVAVLDAAGSSTAAVVGLNDGTLVAMCSPLPIRRDAGRSSCSRPPPSISRPREWPWRTSTRRSLRSSIT